MRQKSLRQLAKEAGVSASYLSQVMHGKKKPSSRVVEVLTKINQSVYLKVNQNTGGSAWESNPPKAFIPPNGFEVREAHRDSSAPSLTVQVKYILLVR